MFPGHYARVYLAQWRHVWPRLLAARKGCTTFSFLNGHLARGGCADTVMNDGLVHYGDRPPPTHIGHLLSALGDKAGGVNIESGKDLAIDISVQLERQLFVSFTSSRSRISALEYTARAKVMRAYVDEL